MRTCVYGNQVDIITGYAEQKLEQNLRNYEQGSLSADQVVNVPIGSEQ